MVSLMVQQKHPIATAQVLASGNPSVAVRVFEQVVRVWLSGKKHIGSTVNLEQHVSSVFVDGWNFSAQC